MTREEEHAMQQESRQRRRWLLAVALVVGLVSAPRAAHAVLLSNTGITAGDFATFAEAPITAPLLTLYDLAPATLGSDGDVASQVFTGIGPAAGLFVYAYDVLNFPTSSETVSGLGLDFFTDPSLTPVLVAGLGLVDSFIINGIGTLTPPLLPPPPGAPFLATPPVGTNFATWFAGTLTFSSAITPWGPGAYSGVFGTFSPVPPMTVIADVLGTGATLASPLAYSPIIPEPGSAVLLGLGLVGGLAARRRKLLC